MIHEAHHASEDAHAVLERMLLGAGVKTQTELAAVLDIGKAAISDAKRRKIVPSDWFLKLCRPPFSLNPMWLETGRGSMRLQDGGADHQVVAENRAAYGKEPEADFMAVPVARPRPASDGGLELAEECGYFRFSVSWLEERGAPDHILLLRIMGEAMYPTLRDGDVVLLDTAQKDVVEGNIYVLRMDGQMIVKRLAKKPGSLVLISDNRSLYEPIEVPFPGSEIAVIGRVVWLGRDI